MLNEYAAHKALMLDELLVDRPTTEQMHFLLELTEGRHDSSSTILCSRCPTDEWRRCMGGGAHADSVMGRKPWGGVVAIAWLASSHMIRPAHSLLVHRSLNVQITTLVRSLSM